MKDQLKKLGEQLGASGGGARWVVGLGALGVLAVLVFAGINAQRPSFKLLYSNLEDAQAAAIQNALAGSGVRFEVSSPPAPFFIHVDEAKYYDAQNAVALSGALDTRPIGIQANTDGARHVFMSASERAQSVLKREWQEMEKQLEVLDFVVRASVSTSTPQSSLGRRAPPPTVAVMLQLKNGTDLAKDQARTAANLVRHRFGVPYENVMISDQNGHSLYDGVEGNELGGSDALDHKNRYDKELAERANLVLDRIFGDDKAYVLVHSEWNHQDLETITEELSPKGTVVSHTKVKTETPQNDSSTGSGATDSNLAIGGASAGTSAAPVTPQLAKTSEETKNSVVGRETRLQRNRSPSLQKLSVSLFLDQSLLAQKEDVEGSVKASVGFDDARGDLFSSMTAPFASLERDDEGNIVPPEPPLVPEEPNRMLEMLLERGVEIIAAAAFLLVLFKTLKKSPKAENRENSPDHLDPNDLEAIELLAKSQVEELVKTDPDRVTGILSRWAAEETVRS